jgi:hypothetical protein
VAPARFFDGTHAIDMERGNVMGAGSPTLSTPAEGAVRMLRPRKWLPLVVFLASFIGLTVGTQKVLEDDPVGWLVAAPCGILTLVSILALHPSASYLELTPEGFTICRVFRKETFRWQEVERFGVMIAGHWPKVLFRYANTLTDEIPRRRLTWPVSAFEAALPSTFGLSTDELAILMNEWHARCMEATKPAVPQAVQLERASSRDHAPEQSVDHLERAQTIEPKGTAP